MLAPVNERPTHDWMGTTYQTILAPQETAGAMSITQIIARAHDGPPRHIHHDADETFVVLSGDVEFWLDGTRFTRGPGETAHIPRGADHTYRVCSDTPARALVILSPGGFENFFVEMAQNNYAIPTDMPAITALATAHHLDFTGPPLEDAS
ncbi:cupin domain-containing protein [Celeribacter arenosi]|uniref:Cupin domain-containing protein n=1 Tax=Celeribacter arenosi TaxID=792649 RepID=A0ABP7JZK8_9RHOB